MKIIICTLGCLGIVTLLTAAAIWIHSWSVAQRTSQISSALWKDQKRLESDLAMGLQPRIYEVMQYQICAMNADREYRCSDLNDYARAVSGFGLMFCTLAIVAWRRQRLPDIELEREADEWTVQSDRDIRDRQIKKHASVTV